MAGGAKKVEFGHRLPQASDVHMAVAKVCPIHGVSLGSRDDRSTWRIDFAPEATPAQRQAAQNALQAFSWEERHPEHVGAPRVVR